MKYKLIKAFENELKTLSINDYKNIMDVIYIKNFYITKNNNGYIIGFKNLEEQLSNIEYFSLSNMCHIKYRELRELKIKNDIEELETILINAEIENTNI